MEQAKENKMGIMPVNKLLITMSLPMMLSMLVQALYNVVDSIFVAMINEDALTAVSLAFPLQSLMIAFAGGTCVGINAILSKALGAKQFERANQAADNGIFLAFVGTILFALIGVVAVKPFYTGQTGSEAIVTYGVQYLTIVCCGALGIFTQFVFDRLLMSTGKTIYTMYTQLAGAITNLILDPILIFGLLGAPKLGVAGAAFATVFGQWVAASLSIVFNLKYNDEIKIETSKILKPDMGMIKDIYVIGIPSIIMQAIGSVMVYGLNRILIAFSSTATAVFGVYFKLQSFVFMPIFGMNNGLVPILAYNFGAGKKDRFLKAMKLGIVYAVSIMFVGFVIFNTCTSQLLSLFSASEHMMALGIPALRIISTSFLLAGFCIICGTVFQALGKATYSMIVSIARQLVVLLPAAYLLSLTGEVNNVWWSFPIAELMSLAMTVFFLIKIYRDIISKIGEDVSMTYQQM